MGRVKTGNKEGWLETLDLGWKKDAASIVAGASCVTAGGALRLRLPGMALGLLSAIVRSITDSEGGGCFRKERVVCCLAVVAVVVANDARWLISLRDFRFEPHMSQFVNARLSCSNVHILHDHTEVADDDAMLHNRIDRTQKTDPFQNV